MEHARTHPPYPKAKRVAVSDTLFGKQIDDPYRWLEDADSAETQAFVTQQSAATDNYLQQIPSRDGIHSRITKLFHYERQNGLHHHAGQYYFWHNDGTQNQPSFWRAATLDGEATCVLDPNTLSDDGTSAVTNTAINEDGTMLAYTVTHGGSDWQEIRVRDLTTGADLADILTFCRFPQVTWHPDGSGFFYNGHLPTTDLTSAEKNRHNKLFWHTLGSEQTQDSIIYERPDEPDWNLPVMLTEDKQYLVSHIWYGAINRNRIYYRPFAEAGPLKPLIDNADADFRFICNVGKQFYFQTDLDAPNYRIIAIDLDQPERTNWREVVAETDNALTFTMAASGKLVLVYMRDASHAILLKTLAGEEAGEITLPTFGSVVSMRCKFSEDELFVDFYSFLHPVTSLRYDMGSGELSELHRPSIDFNVENYETRLRFATSNDGTRVPVFVTHRKGIALDGSHPAILYGYGGFSVNLGPRFSTSRLQWLEMGGVYAQAVLRGGAEYGEAWHQAGMLDKKQNVFDDFASSAEMLIDAGFTNSKALAIQGGSNGGLLVAACMLQRPKLYASVLCHVPVIDMLRYHRFSAGRYWVPEYGDPENEAHFPFMLAYSPLHNVQADSPYPPIMILTADRDDRVVPMHAHKFAATLQHANPDGNPILLRFEFDAGHGFGKSISKFVDEATDTHAFLTATLDAEFVLP